MTAPTPLRIVRRTLAADRESGTALTELAIVAPLFILLLFWAQFFVDLGVLKLKAEEAARFAVWEMVAQRSPSQVAADVQQRFADLASPESMSGNRARDNRSFQTVTATVNIQENVDASFSANVPPPSGGGVIGEILQFLHGFVAQTVDSMLRQLQFDSRGGAIATVTLAGDHRLFPGGLANRREGGPIFEASGLPTRITVTATSPMLLVDVWKAWPHRKARAGQNLEVSPEATYPTSTGTASPPELEVSRRLERVAFFGAKSWLDTVDSILGAVNLGKPFSTATWANDGPVAMWPGEPARQGQLDGIGYARHGDHRSRSTAADAPRYEPIRSNGLDRARFTVPTRIVTSAAGGVWTGSRPNGGARRVPWQVTTANNPYQRMYTCRDINYMGARTNRPRWGTDLQTWARQSFPGCTTGGQPWPN